MNLYLSAFHPTIAFQRQLDFLLRLRCGAAGASDTSENQDEAGDANKHTEPNYPSTFSVTTVKLKANTRNTFRAE